MLRDAVAYILSVSVFMGCAGLFVWAMKPIEAVWHKLMMKRARAQARHRLAEKRRREAHEAWMWRMLDEDYYGD